jgi:hypothetical protein
MPATSITTAAAALCHQMIANPAADSDQRSLAGQFLAFVESVCFDSPHDPYYEDCIRHLALDMTGQAL